MAVLLRAKVARMMKVLFVLVIVREEAREICLLWGEGMAGPI